MTRFRASQCAGPGFWMNWDKILIANAISGHDMTAGHKTLPTALVYGIPRILDSWLVVDGPWSVES